MTKGTIGVVLNRPTNLVPATIFPELAQGIGSYAGASLSRRADRADAAAVLVRGLAAATVNGPEVLDKVFLSIDDASLPDMVRLADGTDELRLYAGHAAWVARPAASGDQCRRLAIAARLRRSSCSTPIPAVSGRSSKAAGANGVNVVAALGD